VVAVAKKKGVRLALVGGTLDIAKLALTPSERFASLGSAGLTWKHSVLLAVGVKFRKMRSSMLLAWERKRTPEIDFLNGEIVRQGEALGIATPVNARLVREVRAVFAGEQRPSLENVRALHAELVPAARAQARAAAR
jgi:2-dehydropantoate 2-reductase